MEATISSETSVHTRRTRRHIPEDGILQFSIIYVFTISSLFICLFLLFLTALSRVQVIEPGMAELLMNYTIGKDMEGRGSERSISEHYLSSCLEINHFGENRESPHSG
jgi:hypothetical protein